MATVTICSDFGAQENSLFQFPFFPHLIAMKWWDRMSHSYFFEGFLNGNSMICWETQQQEDIRDTGSIS